ncbi:sulfotransferase [Synechococcus sp. CS-1329]|jgi:hypothetical protein|uniref:sulfotransferase n=1 Tax=Synechococcus sp. CS-1329 TaxID=2847975 RepID=UPI00223C4303|nr:sulfotransferase [Synechococcus sp. CS-1329]MCT0219123.1 sulfotransferase [Synechococcus sp. CS-1329]
MANPNLLLIRGLGHSGTTILDLILGSHSRMVGLGEAVRILEPISPGQEQRGPAQLRQELRHTRRCTCGETAAHCPVWGPLLEWLPAHDESAITDKLQRLLGQVSGLSRSDHPITWAVDSYQSDLQVPLLPMPGVEVRLVHLVRDVRSWVHSRSSGSRSAPGAAWRSLARWARTNAQVTRVLQRSGRPVFLLGYEELALAPEAAITKLCAWLNLDYEPAMLRPAQAAEGSHILSGNRMRFDPSRSSAIRYDTRWLSGSHPWIGLAAQLPPLQAMNRRLVYSNQLL